MNLSTSTKIGLGIGFTGAIIVSILIVLTIFRSTSSTAAIGFIFIPVWFSISFIAFFIFGYCIGYIRTWLKNSSRVFNLKISLAIIISIFFAIFVILDLAKGIILTSLTSQIREINSNQELLDRFENSYFNRNKFVLGAIAQNPAASAELLDQIVKLDDPALQEAMGSLFPVLGENTKGLAVMRLVIGNPNVSSASIEYLANTSNVNYVLGDIAKNPKTSVETLRQLETKKNYLIDWGLAGNTKTPPDIFTKLLDRGNDSTQRTTLEILQRNLAAPPEIRIKASELLKEY